jgi:hypothetical protein
MHRHRRAPRDVAPSPWWKPMGVPGAINSTWEHDHAPRGCVFIGSSPGRDPAYATAARDLATLLAARGIGLVYGGASSA